MILRTLDALLHIVPEEKPVPLPPTDKSTQEVILKELHADMRAQRETELKMVPLFFQVCAFVLTGNLIVLTSTNPRIDVTMCAFIVFASLAFIVAFWLQLHVRIAHDHGTYRFLATRVYAIRDAWAATEFLRPPESRKPFGAGPGYRMNQRLVALSALSICGILIGVFVLRFTWSLHAL